MFRNGLRHAVALVSLFSAAAVTAAPVPAAGTEPAPIKTSIARPTTLDLAPDSDQRLQTALTQNLAALRLDGFVKEGRLAVSLVDVTDPAAPLLAQVNGDRMFYAASLPKIAILLGVFEKAARDGIAIDAATTTELQQMIRHSSNTAASAMLARVGTPYLAQVLQSDRYRLYDAKGKGGLWVGKPYAGGAATLRDPLRGLSHAATAFETARFYYLLETGQLVSPAASRQMKEIMGSPAIHHKFVAGLEKLHPHARLFRKSGTWKNFHSDSAIVEHDGRRYIAVALSDDARGGEWLKALIGGLDDAIFRTAGQQVATLARKNS